MSARPRYPVYVISKGRYGKEGLTARFLARDGVPFSLVVEPQEYDAYAAAFCASAEQRALCTLRALPFSNLGQGSIPARNWCWTHSKEAGAARHWILDDNISGVRRWVGGKRVPCASGPIFAATEDFVDRYTNVAIGGLTYTMFAIRPGGGSPKVPFYLNKHVYSCLLIRNDLPQRWRGRYNEDTDLCLQVLAAGWCTINMNAFMIDKIRTMTMAGGNAAELYQGDGRLKMARALERQWPGVVTTRRRFQRPQHHVKDNWGYFDTPLQPRPDLDKTALAAAGPDEYGMRVVQVAETVKSPRMRQLLADQQEKQKEARCRDAP